MSHARHLHGLIDPPAVATLIDELLRRLLDNNRTAVRLRDDPPPPRGRRPDNGRGETASVGRWSPFRKERCCGLGRLTFGHNRALSYAKLGA